MMCLEKLDGDSQAHGKGSEPRESMIILVKANE